MSNAGIVHTTNDLKEHLISEPTYGSTLDTLEEGHTIGVMRTSNVSDKSKVLVLVTKSFVT